MTPELTSPYRMLDWNALGVLCFSPIFTFVACWLCFVYMRKMANWWVFTFAKRIKLKKRIVSPMITIQNKPPGQRWIELGCGQNPNPSADVHCDIRFIEGVTDFVVNMEEPFPIKDEDFDGIICSFAFEHVSYQKVPQALAECLRILKPGGRLLISVPNLEAQMEWVRRNPEGWDGKDFFHSASEVVFGTGDYNGNNHRSFWSPPVAHRLFSLAGFVDIITSPYGERGTDMVVDAKKPLQPLPQQREHQVVKKEEVGQLPPELLQPPPVQQPPNHAPLETTEQRAQVFGKDYFNGGHKWGGYAHQGYSDFPVHWRTFNHVMQRKPESVLEIGAARAYIGKRLEDAGVNYTGLEISKHCYLTRVCNSVRQHDLCKTPWPVAESKVNSIPVPSFDLCFSIATLEHIPEKHIEGVIKEMVRTCKRGLHGIDFGHRDDGFDRTHCTLRPKEWWQATFARYAPGWPVEIVDKEELEQPCLANDIPQGDGKLKLNVGSHTTMFYHGWLNLDQQDLNHYAMANGYHFQRYDAKGSLPIQTGAADMVFAHHFLEHLSMKEARAWAKDVRRALKPTGVLRVVVPDTETVMRAYTENQDGYLEDWKEINDGVANAKTQMEKVAELLLPDHKMLLDYETVQGILEEAGFVASLGAFRKVPPPLSKAADLLFAQMQKEVTEMTFGGLSLFVDAVPKIS